MAASARTSSSPHQEHRRIASFAPTSGAAGTVVTVTGTNSIRRGGSQGPAEPERRGPNRRRPTTSLSFPFLRNELRKIVGRHETSRQRRERADFVVPPRHRCGRRPRDHASRHR
jgi:hypothetical protein